MARFFCIFHAVSFELNFFSDRKCPLMSEWKTSDEHIVFKLPLSTLDCSHKDLISNSVSLIESFGCILLLFDLF